MGKSFTQFLLGAVAALLLALPVQAGPKDPLSRKAPGIYPAKNMLTEKYTKGHNAAEAALLSLEANKETRLTSLQKLILEKERENAWIKGNAPWSPAQIGKKYHPPCTPGK